MTQDRFGGCLLGLAAGDAVGPTVEFRPWGSFQPLTDLVGSGPFHLEPGQWTDDTSMARCLAVSLVERGGLDARDQMERSDPARSQTTHRRERNGTAQRKATESHPSRRQPDLAGQRTKCGGPGSSGPRAGGVGARPSPHK